MKRSHPSGPRRVSPLFAGLASLLSLAIGIAAGSELSRALSRPHSGAACYIVEREIPGLTKEVYQARRAELSARVAAARVAAARAARADARADSRAD